MLRIWVNRVGPNGELENDAGIAMILTPAPDGARAELSRLADIEEFPTRSGGSSRARSRAK